MKPETVCTVVFSPTGTSKKIAETVARSIASDAGTEAAALKTIDLTHAAAHSAALSAGAVAVIAAPVYGDMWPRRPQKDWKRSAARERPPW